MAYTDIEREIEARYIKGLRRVFEFEDDFRYNKNESETGVIISSEFPAKDCSFKIPHMVVSGISYQSDLQNTLNHNFHSDIRHNGIVNYAQESVHMLPYSLNIVCLGEYDVSRNLANRLAYLINFRAFHYLSEQLGLRIRNTSKGQFSPKEQYPEKVFQTPFGIQGMMVLSVVETPFNYLENNQSVPIDKKGETFKRIELRTNQK